MRVGRTVRRHRPREDGPSPRRPTTRHPGRAGPRSATTHGHDESTRQGGHVVEPGPEAPRARRERQEGGIDEPVRRRDLFDESRQSDTGARREDHAAGSPIQRAEHQGERRDGEEIEEMLHVRSVAEDVWVGARDRIDEGRETGRGRAADAESDPPDQNDRREDVGDRHEPDRQLIGPADRDGQGVEPVPERRLVLGQVAIEDVAAEHSPAHIGIGRLVAVERLDLAGADEPAFERPRDRRRADRVPPPGDVKGQNQHEPGHHRTARGPFGTARSVIGEAHESR